MKTISQWLAQYILPYGAPGLFLVALIDSGLIPMPQGVDLLLFTQVVRDPSRVLLYATLATVGSLLGCIFLYYVSRKAGEVALNRHASPRRIDRVRKQIEKYEAFTLVLPTMIPLPLPMKLFVVAAGVFKVRLGLFILAILFGRVVRYFGIALLAHHYGAWTWTYLRQNIWLIGVVVAFLLGFFYWLESRLE